MSTKKYNRSELTKKAATGVISDPERLFSLAEEWATNTWDFANPGTIRLAGHIILQLLFGDNDEQKNAD